MNARLCSTAVILSVLATAGCSFNVPQLATVERLIPTFGKNSRESLAPFTWSLSLSGMQYRVYAQKVQGRRVTFVNDYGMEVVWDGDSFITVDGMPGGFGPYRSGREISVSGQEERWYAMASAPVHRARCGSPQLWRLSEDRYGWRQKCVGSIDGVIATTDHVVEFDGRGQTRLIEASVFPGGPLITLKKIDP